jgi:cytochrome c55X
LLKALILSGLLLTSAVARAEPMPGARRDALMNLLRHDCGSCHGLTMKGGLGPPLLPRALADKPDEALVETILDGRAGTPMPPWRFSLDAEEAAWMVRRLKEGLKP